MSCISNIVQYRASAIYPRRRCLGPPCVSNISYTFQRCLSPTLTGFCEHWNATILLVFEWTVCFLCDSQVVRGRILEKTREWQFFSFRHNIVRALVFEGMHDIKLHINNFFNKLRRFVSLNKKEEIKKKVKSTCRIKFTIRGILGKVKSRNYQWERRYWNKMYM